MGTPLRGRSGGHAGAAPTVSFGWIARGRLALLGWIACKWLFGLCGIAWKNMMEIGRGGACVPARVALQGRIHRSSPCTMRAFLYGNAAVRTFGRACRRRPYGFVWMGWAGAGLIVHQGADVLAVHHAFKVAIDVHVEHIDGQVVFLAHGGGGEVHHF